MLIGGDVCCRSSVLETVYNAIYSYNNVCCAGIKDLHTTFKAMIDYKFSRSYCMTCVEGSNLKALILSSSKEKMWFLPVLFWPL